jgi:hypothetical protein
VANPDFTQLNNKVSEAFGIKSLTVLERPNIKYCNISLKENNTLKIMPTKHAVPPDKGHLHKPDESICITYLSMKKL